MKDRTIEEVYCAADICSTQFERFAVTVATLIKQTQDPYLTNRTKIKRLKRLQGIINDAIYNL